MRLLKSMLTAGAMALCLSVGAALAGLFGAVGASVAREVGVSPFVGQWSGVALFLFVGLTVVILLAEDDQ